MIHHNLNKESKILTVTPEGPLQSSDFEELAAAADPFIEAEGELNGLLIDAPVFPGWEHFGDMVSHFKFVKNHERHIKKIAIISDSSVLSVMPKFASHFMHAKVQHFPASEKSQAMEWLTEQ